MKATHLISFLSGVLLTGSLFLLTAATPAGTRVDVTQDWPEEVRSIAQLKSSPDRFYRKYAVEDLDLYFSEDLPRDPRVVILRRGHPSPWVEIKRRGIDIWDKAGSLISADSIDSPGVVDRFSYASERDGKFTYYCDHNLDGTLDVITTHYPNSQPPKEPQTRIFIQGVWYELTDERYFEGEWVPEARVLEAFRAKKKETRNYSRAKTSEGFKIVKWDRGIPSFVESVE